MSIKRILLLFILVISSGTYAGKSEDEFKRDEPEIYELAIKGNSTAQAITGNTIIGYLFVADEYYKEALYWARKSHDSNNPYGTQLLAELYASKGEASFLDGQKAIQYATKSLEMSGSSKSARLLVAIYYSGELVAKDLPLAYGWALIYSSLVDRVNNSPEYLKKIDSAVNEIRSSLRDSEIRFATDFANARIKKYRKIKYDFESGEIKREYDRLKKIQYPDSN
jgi:hypothetical protein